MGTQIFNCELPTHNVKSLDAYICCNLTQTTRTQWK